MSQVQTLQNGTPVCTQGMHRFGTDALLLAGFCRPRRAEEAVDLCSGCGIVSLAWHDLGHRGPCLAVEIDPAGTQLLQEAQTLCPDAQHIRPLAADLRTLAADKPHTAHLVACNPPYFAAGPKSPDPVRAAARHEESCTLWDAAACAARLLRDGGRFAFCYPPDRMAGAFAALAAAGLEPKRLVFVKKDATRAPWLFLCEAQKGRAPGLRILPDLLTGTGGPGYQYLAVTD